MLIKKRPADGIYFCQLSLKPPSPPPPQLLDSCSSSLDTQFRLGLIGDAEKYIQQYVKIFSEDGRRPISIKHNIIHSSTPLSQQNQSSNGKNKKKRSFFKLGEKRGKCRNGFKDYKLVKCSPLDADIV